MHTLPIDRLTGTMWLLHNVPRRLSLALLLATSAVLAAVTVCFYPILYPNAINTSQPPLLSARADQLTFHSLPALTASTAVSISLSARDSADSSGSSSNTGISVSCEPYPAVPLLVDLLVPLHSRITGTTQLGLPSSEVKWDERSVSCPAMPQPLMIPPFESYCAAHRSQSAIPASYQWTVLPGPWSKPGFVHLCYNRSHSGGALLTLTDAFAGPHGFIYNSSHAITMNPWYAARYDGETSAKRAADSGAHSIECYDELVWAHSVYDDVGVGPHTLLEVAPILSHLLDSTPPHIPIVLRYTPALQAAYSSLHLDSDRIVAYDPSVVYHARRMWWFRRPEEYTDKYWQSIRHRLFNSTLRPLPPPSTNYRPVIVYLHRLKPHRSLTNADEFVSALHDSFPASSYDVVVFNGSLSLSQSVALFSRTALIVGPHGGAFLNAMFLPPLSSVIEIAYPDSTNSMPFPPYYYLMSCGLRLLHHVVVAQQGRYDSPMIINVSQVVDSMWTALTLQWEQRILLVGQQLLVGQMTAEETGSLGDGRLPIQHSI